MSHRATVVAALLSISLVTPSAQESPLDHIIEPDARGDPGGAAAAPYSRVADALAMRISGAARIPIGFEASKDEDAVPGKGEAITLSGRTVREALDEITRIDPRYRWQEMNGVIVIRSRKAWVDEDNALNRPVVSVAEELRPSAWVRRIMALIHNRGGSRMNDASFDIDDRVVSVKVPSGSVLDLLNEFVRAHGELSWSVAYRDLELQQPEPGFGLTVYDFDGKGFGVRSPKPPPTEDTAPGRD